MKTLGKTVSIIILCFFSVLFLFPVFIIVINSLKIKFSINADPFSLPNNDTFTGLENYVVGIESTGFLTAVFWSLFITVFSVLAILIFTSMTAWYIVRVKSKFTSILYYAFVFSMIVPFQMVMFTMSKTEIPTDAAKNRSEEIRNPMVLTFKG